MIENNFSEHCSHLVRLPFPLLWSPLGLVLSLHWLLLQLLSEQRFFAAVVEAVSAIGDFSASIDPPPYKGNQQEVITILLLSKTIHTARHGTARHGTARHGTARQGKARQGVWRGRARQGKAGRGKARQGKARQGKAGWSLAGQGRAQSPLTMQGYLRFRALLQFFVFFLQFFNFFLLFFFCLFQFLQFLFQTNNFSFVL